ncbi:MAG: hypothetical protein ACRDLN_04040 [Solirubrobacteraceae bacterium]
MSDDADELFEAAEHEYTRLGAATWLARCRLDHASLLLERARATDAQRASGLIAGAFATARELDLRGVTLRAARCPRARHRPRERPPRPP